MNCDYDEKYDFVRSSRFITGDKAALEHHVMSLSLLWSTKIFSHDIWFLSARMMSAVLRFKLAYSRSPLTSGRSPAYRILIPPITVAKSWEGKKSARLFRVFENVLRSKIIWLPTSLPVICRRFQPIMGKESILDAPSPPRICVLSPLFGNTRLHYYWLAHSHPSLL